MLNFSKKLTNHDPEGDCHGDCKHGADDPDDQDDALRPGLGGVALEREHDGLVPVHGDGCQGEDAGVHTQVLRTSFMIGGQVEYLEEWTEGTEEGGQVPSLEQGCLELKTRVRNVLLNKNQSVNKIDKTKQYYDTIII